MTKPKKIKIAHLSPEEQRAALIEGMRRYGAYKARSVRSATMYLKSMGISVDKSGTISVAH